MSPFPCLARVKEVAIVVQIVGNRFPTPFSGLFRALDMMSPEERHLLTVQDLLRRIAKNTSPECEEARAELVSILAEQDDPRVAWVEAEPVPKTSRLVDLGMLASEDLQQGILLRLCEQFPEFDQKVSLKQGIGPHYIRRIV